MCKLVHWQDKTNVNVAHINLFRQSLKSIFDKSLFGQKTYDAIKSHMFVTIFVQKLNISMEDMTHSQLGVATMELPVFAVYTLTLV